MMFELLAFTVVASIVVATLAIIIFLIGLPLDLNFGTAIAIAVYIFAVVLPGVANLWIAAFATGGEDRVERATAGVRGIAMIGGWTLAICLLAPRHGFMSAIPWLIGICFVMFVWSIWRETRHQTQELERKGLLKRD